MNTNDRTGEAKMQPIVLKILNQKPNGQATIDDIIAEVPQHITLTAGDLLPSQTRDGEALWEQIVRNIRSHSESPNNYIARGYIEEFEGGYKITTLGRTKVIP